MIGIPNGRKFKVPEQVPEDAEHYRMKVRCGNQEATVRGFSLSQIAKILGRRPISIIVWGRSGILPPPANRIRKGGAWRAYTEDEVQVILDAYHEVVKDRERKLSMTPFPSMVREGFKRLKRGVREERYQ